MEDVFISLVEEQENAAMPLSMEKGD